jgi:Fur family ferric uptake transcriptional regulator
MTSWAEQANQALAEAGYRRGGARSAIVALLDGQTCALSPAEAGELLRARGREVSRASVYRVIEQLDALGLLQRVEAGHGIVRYEPARQGPGHHHHLVCERCGRIEPFTDQALEQAISRLDARVPLRVATHEVVLRGACETCEPT